jgi:hypothetical protein
LDCKCKKLICFAKEIGFALPTKNLFLGLYFDKKLRMMKYVGIFALLLFALTSFGQTDTAPATVSTPTKRYSRPDIPGTFAIEIGVNNALNKPTKFDLGFWGSRTINLYYSYDLRLFKSKMSLVPGVGFSFERFKFRNEAVMGIAANGDSLKLMSPSEAGYSNVKKSMLITNYIDVPIELRYSSRPDDPTRSFKLGVGYRVGYMIESYTKLKYVKDGETRKLKDSQRFHLQRFRHGLFAKIGVGNVSVFGYYNLTPLFESGKGPVEKKIAAPDFNTFTLGISFASF